MTDWISCSSSGALASVFRFSRYFYILSSGSRIRLPAFIIFQEKLLFLVRFLLDRLCLDLRSSLSRRSRGPCPLSTSRLMTLLLLSREMVFLEGEREGRIEFCECRSQILSSFLARKGSYLISCSSSDSSSLRGNLYCRLGSHRMQRMLISIMVLDLIFSSLVVSSAVRLQLWIIFISRLCRYALYLISWECR